MIDSAQIDMSTAAGSIDLSQIEHIKAHDFNDDFNDDFNN